MERGEGCNVTLNDDGPNNALSADMAWYTCGCCLASICAFAHYTSNPRGARFRNRRGFFSSMLVWLFACLVTAACATYTATLTKDSFAALSTNNAKGVCVRVCV